MNCRGAELARNVIKQQHLKIEEVSRHSFQDAVDVAKKANDLERVRVPSRLCLTGVHLTHETIEAGKCQSHD